MHTLDTCTHATHIHTHGTPIIIKQSTQTNRLAVLYAFPMFMLPVVSMRGCIVFRRDGVKDKEVRRWLI
jgi:hypothetical protein